MISYKWLIGNHVGIDIDDLEWPWTNISWTCYWMHGFSVSRAWTLRFVMFFALRMDILMLQWYSEWNSLIKSHCFNVNVLTLYFVQYIKKNFFQFFTIHCIVLLLKEHGWTTSAWNSYVWFSGYHWAVLHKWMVSLCRPMLRWLIFSSTI